MLALPRVQDHQAHLPRHHVPKLCGGFLTEKRSKRGKVFFGCSSYAKTGCDFVLWDRPIPEPCPQCGATFLVKKENRRGIKIRCIKEGCGYQTESGETGEPAQGDAA